VRGRKAWEKELEIWDERAIQDKRVVYLRADGVSFNLGLTGEGGCILVVIGA